jgi:hypothetical protein
MKHARKMILVPEAEYYALLNMFKQNVDPIKGESVSVSEKIRKNLADKSTGADVKEKRHSWLYKRRRQLKDMVENKPQKVIIENISAIPNVAPYLGIQKTMPRLDEAMEEENGDRRNILRQGSLNGIDDSGDRSRYTSAASEYSDNGTNGTSSSSVKTVMTPTPKTQPFKLTSAHKTSPRNYTKLLNIIGKDPIKYGVEKDTGQVITNFNKAVQGSDYTKSLQYMTGQSDSPPKGHKFFLQRLGKDPKITKFFNNSSQQGEGRKKKRVRFVFVKKTSIKTPGLERVKKKAI